MKDKKVLKSGIWYTVSNFFVKSLNFLSVPLFTRLLTKEEFGSYSNFLSWLNIAIVVITLNVEASLISAKTDFEKKLDEYILSVLFLSTCSSLIWILLVIIFWKNFNLWLSIQPEYLVLMLVYLIALSAINLYQVKERYDYKYKITVFISVVVAVSTTLISIVLVLFMKDKLFGRILGSMIPTIIIGIIIYIVLIKEGKKLRFYYWKYAFSICLPYIPHLLSLTLLNSIDRVMITKICGSIETALYSVAYTCGSIITMLMLSINNAFVPWLREKMSLKEYDAIKKIIKPYIIIFSLLAVAIMLFSPDVLNIIGGDKYIEAKYVMVPVSLGCVFQFLYTIFVNIEQIMKKTLPMAFASISAALLNYVLNLIFIPKYGYISAAYTTLVGYIWLMIVHMFIVYKINYSFLFNYKFVVIFSIILGIISLIMNILYKILILRIFVIFMYIIFILVLIIKHRKIIKYRIFKR